MFYQARYYDAAVGRFVQADTIIPDPYNSQSLNRYSYTRNNPVRYTDPTGHCDPDECRWTHNEDGGWTIENTGDEVLSGDANLSGVGSNSDTSIEPATTNDSQFGTTYELHGTPSAHNNYDWHINPKFNGAPATINSWSIGGGAADNFIVVGLDLVVNWQTDEVGAFAWSTRPGQGFVTPQLAGSAQYSFAWGMQQVKDYGGPFDTTTASANIFTGEVFASRDRTVKGYGGGETWGPFSILSASLGSYTADYTLIDRVTMDARVTDALTYFVPVHPFIRK